MDFKYEKRIEKLVDYHQQTDVELGKQLCLQLEPAYRDALERRCILESCSRVQLIRLLLASHIEALGGAELVMENPAGLFEFYRKLGAAR